MTITPKVNDMLWLEKHQKARARKRHANCGKVMEGPGWKTQPKPVVHVLRTLEPTNQVQSWLVVGQLAQLATLSGKKETHKFRPDSNIFVFGRFAGVIRFCSQKHPNNPKHHSHKPAPKKGGVWNPRPPNEVLEPSTHHGASASRTRPQIGAASTACDRLPQPHGFQAPAERLRFVPPPPRASVGTSVVHGLLPTRASPRASQKLLAELSA